MRPFYDAQSVDESDEPTTKALWRQQVPHILRWLQERTAEQIEERPDCSDATT